MKLQFKISEVLPTFSLSQYKKTVAMLRKIFGKRKEDSCAPRAENLAYDGTTPSICVVGAGFSGLTAGIKLKTELGLSFTIFDENEEVGGTWLVNTYPGCACDVQSLFYSWSFEPNLNWTQNYGTREEILEYMKTAATKYDLYRHIKFRTQVKTLVWNEFNQKWHVKIYNKDVKEEEELLFDIIINGPGALRIPNIPEEFKAFQGPMVHSGAWDSSLEWEDKVVAVVGSGSSAIQLIETMGPKVKELHCYQRNAAWVMSRVQKPFTRFHRWAFAYIPFFLLIIRWIIFLTHELYHKIFLHNSWTSLIIGFLGIRYLRLKVDPKTNLEAKLTPSYPIGCKRVLISTDYFTVMGLSNVKLHTDPIMEVEADGIRTAESGSQKIDLLVLATGFKVQDFFAPMQIIGKNSANIMECWKEESPRTLLGITASNMPNLFSLMGAGTGVVHSSMIFMGECQMGYIVQLLREMMRRGAKVVRLKEAAERDFQTELKEQMKKTVWAQGKCHSWFGNEKGQVTALWPQSCISYWRKTRTADFTNFEFY